MGGGCSLTLVSALQLKGRWVRTEAIEPTTAHREFFDCPNLANLNIHKLVDKRFKVDSSRGKFKSCPARAKTKASEVNLESEMADILAVSRVPVGSDKITVGVGPG